MKGLKLFLYTVWDLFLPADGLLIQAIIFVTASNFDCWFSDYKACYIPVYNVWSLNWRQLINRNKRKPRLPGNTCPTKNKDKSCWLRFVTGWKRIVLIKCGDICLSLHIIAVSLWHWRIPFGFHVNLRWYRKFDFRLFFYLCLLFLLLKSHIFKGKIKPLWLKIIIWINCRQHWLKWFKNWMACKWAIFITNISSGHDPWQTFSKYLSNSVYDESFKVEYERKIRLVVAILKP